MALGFLSPPTSAVPDFAQTVRAAVENGAVPVLCGSSKTGGGCGEIREFLCTCMPEMPDVSEELCARVFRVEHDRQLGKLCHVRVFSGGLQPRQSVYLPRVDKEEKIAGIRRPMGRKQADVPAAEAGDIAVLFGLSEVRAGDMIGRGKPPRKESALAVPLLTVKVEPEKPDELMAFMIHQMIKNVCTCVQRRYLSRSLNDIEHKLSIIIYI